MVSSLETVASMSLIGGLSDHSAYMVNDETDYSEAAHIRSAPGVFGDFSVRSQIIIERILSSYCESICRYRVSTSAICQELFFSLTSLLFSPDILYMSLYFSPSYGLNRLPASQLCR